MALGRALDSMASPGWWAAIGSVWRGSRHGGSNLDEQQDPVETLSCHIFEIKLFGCCVYERSPNEGAATIADARIWNGDSSRAASLRVALESSALVVRLCSG
ncbi:hypothetical protein BAUCODRAFT_556731 [Baudoinia panamericana UAMH 10762]|uniref:Uncharacterized protein n=1 Tax=Baudoinia panamericana (strain UAMH 10762) TaxID=717646 RepID=M2MDQ2_BAUPA|nr:uncharacterized protein BAUCODRAFT_556731 [Baudoinia panamericana UAMH 10762]EMC94686.1 hypothetical protein BAUCODRAFT_556731 [Baudoinia panamericana UAMH 10762]